MCSHACTQGLALGEEINAATRKTHARINRMIIARLFQALPPSSDNAMKYIQGLMALASLYYNFEAPLYEMIQMGKRQRHGPARPAQPRTDGIPDECCDNQGRDLTWVVRAYEALNVDALLRSPRIFEDVKALLQNQRAARYYNVMDAFSAQLRDGQKLSKLHSRLRQSPHIFIAHAWSLYLACHSGGQLIRQVLLSMPVGFWLNEMDLINGPEFHTWLAEEDVAKAPPILDTPKRPQNDTDGEPTAFLPPFQELTSTPRGSNSFSFWEIRSEEPTKNEFKEGLKQVEGDLSPTQRAEIIDEAKRVFDDFEKVIKSLDIVCATNFDELDDRAAGSWFRRTARGPPDGETP